MGNGLSGSPLTQVMVYTLNHSCPELVDIELMERLADTALDVNVYIFLSAKKESASRTWCSPIELAIMLKRIDVVKLLVTKGANAIDPHEKIKAIPQLFVEYFSFGTNDYMKWLFDEHLRSQEILGFIQTVLNCNIMSGLCLKSFEKIGRHPAHAVLTCGCEEFIREFLKKYGESYLTVEDTVGKTALQISAERGYQESVEVLLKV